MKRWLSNWWYRWSTTLFFWGICSECNHANYHHYWVDDKFYCHHTSQCGCGYHCGR